MLGFLRTSARVCADQGPPSTVFLSFANSRMAQGQEIPGIASRAEERQLAAHYTPEGWGLSSWG